MNLGINNPYIMSRAQAERIFKSGFPTFEEMIEGAKDRFRLPLEAWADFDAVIAEKTGINKKLRGSVMILREVVLGHKRLAIGLLIAISILSFFTLVPAGRTLAKNFFDMIIRIDGNRLIIQSRNPDYVDAIYGEDGDTIFVERPKEADIAYTPGVEMFSNIDKFIEKTGYRPIVVDSEWCEHSSIELRSTSEQGLILTTKYLDREGLQINIIQQWNSDAEMSCITNAEGYEERIILDNRVMYYSIDVIDHSFGGVALLDDSIVMIGAEEGVDIELLLDSIERK